MGMTSGPGFPPPAEPYSPPASAFNPLPPPPRRPPPPDNTIRNLLIGLIFAVVFVVPLTAWIVTSNSGKATKEDQAARTAKAVAEPPPEPAEPAETQPPMPTEPPASADPNDRPQRRGKGVQCCCDGSTAKCGKKKKRKSCCKGHGGVCACANP